MTRVVVLLACLLPATTSAAVEPIPVRELRDGDTLWVSYSSSGCFHSYRAELTIYGRNPNVAHEKFWNRYILNDEPEKPRVATVELTKQDRRGLDSIVVYCRTQPVEQGTSKSQAIFFSSRKGRRSTRIQVNGAFVPGVISLDELVMRELEKSSSR